MSNTTTALTAAGETYFADLGRVRASGGATGERSSYGPLANCSRIGVDTTPANAVGATLAPKVFCVGELADQGAGHPRLRALRGEAGAAGPTTRGAGTGARRGRGERPPETTPGSRRRAIR